MVEPTGWTDTSSTNSEIQIIQLTAPASYADAPTTLTVNSLIGIVAASVTAHQEATDDATAHSKADTSFAAGPVMDCKVQGDDASFYSFTDGGKTGNHLYLIHNHLLYDALLVGTGGISDQSLADYMAVLGSWTWVA
jgi:hypothetical protein